MRSVCCWPASRASWRRSRRTTKAFLTFTGASTRLRAASGPGRTRSDGEIAAELGDKGLSRAVGQALGHNLFAPVVPCHRVLAAAQRDRAF